MDFKHASFEFAADLALIHRHRYPNSGMVACELPMPMFYSKILEGDLSTRLRIYLNRYRLRDTAISLASDSRRASPR